MKQLTALVKKSSNLQSEIKKLDDGEEELRREESRILDTAEIGDESAIEKLTKIRARLDVIPGQRKRLERDLRALNPEIRSTFYGDRADIEARVISKQLAAETAVVAQLTGIFGDEKTARTALNRTADLHSGLVEIANQRATIGGFNLTAEAEPHNTARQFIDYVEQLKLS